MKLALSTLLLLAAYAVFSQPCATPSSQIDLQGNALRARLLAGGRFGSDLFDASYHPNYMPGVVNPSTIFISELWYGGIDPGGNLRINTGYFTGPLDPATGTTTATDCANWDRFYRVTATEINAFLDDLSDGSLSAPHVAVRGWPARGNPFFAGITGFNLPDQNLAPFHDADGDGVYDPMKGDYPVVELQGLSPFVPDEQIWTVVNDQGGGPGSTFVPIRAEVQITYFAFNCPDKPLLNNAMFTSHQFISRSTEVVDSFSIALYTDFDLGCYSDDYVGCAPANNTFYVYNRTNTDIAATSCSGIPSYGANPPVQAATMLNKSLDFFIPIYNASVGNPEPATTNPTMAEQYFYYLNGRWRDNLPITSGGSGYDPMLSNPLTTQHAFPGNPNNATEWSMVSANQPARDQRGLGVHKAGPLFPGQILEMNTAWTYHRSPGLSNLQNVDLMLDEVPHLHVLYANSFAGVCAPTVSANEPLRRQQLTIWPNPAADEMYLRLAGTGSGIVQVFDQTGRSVWTQTFTDTDALRLDTGSWPRGTYVVQLRTTEGAWVQKVVLSGR